MIVPQPSKRTAMLAAALAAGALFVAAATPLSPESKLAAALFDRASNWYPFTIQNVMWLFFFVCLGELTLRYLHVRANATGLKAGYLSERPEVFYDQEDIRAIRKNIHDRSDLLAQLIRTVTIRYQISHRAVDETHQMLNSQLELLQFKMDVEYSMIRYIIWLIPTLGFIGTVVGISNTLAVAGVPGAAEQSDFLHTLTLSLALAFDTTMLALVLSAILVYLMHIVQGMEERMIGTCGSYCLDNLINKLISKDEGGR